MKMVKKKKKEVSSLTDHFGQGDVASQNHIHFPKWVESHIFSQFVWPAISPATAVLQGQSRARRTALEK